MNYIITNMITKETFNFQFERSRQSLRAFIVNSTSSRSEFELFRSVAQYGIENFKIENQIEFDLSQANNQEAIARVEYRKIIDGKTDSKPAVFKEKKQKKTRKKRKLKKDVT